MDDLQPESLGARFARHPAILRLTSLALALFAMPVLASYTLRHGVKPHNDEGWFEHLRNLYRRLLTGALKLRVLTISIGVIIATVALGSVHFLT